MILSEYARAKREVQKGTPVYLTVSQKDCDMQFEGVLEAVEHHKIVLTNGKSYPYQMVKSMTALIDFKPYLRCKKPSEACRNCEFLKQCQKLNPFIILVSPKEGEAVV